MKNKTSFLISLVVILTIGVSCKKGKFFKTDTPPEISGLDPVFLSKGQSATDPGVSASDKEDGDLSQLVSSDWAQVVNTSKVGTYVVTYQVTDLDDNSTFEQRIVSVEYRDGFPNGTYQLNFGKRIQYNFLQDTVATTCTIAPTTKSDVFLVKYLHNNAQQEFTFVPKANPVEKVSVFIDICRGPVTISPHQDTITFEAMGTGRSESVVYTMTVKGKMTKIP